MVVSVLQAGKLKNQKVMGQGLGGIFGRAQIGKEGRDSQLAAFGEFTGYLQTVCVVCHALALQEQHLFRL